MKVALYVTCLVDQFAPQVGFAAVRLLEHAGCEVEFDAAQTCCGQPMCNTGYPAQGRELARAVVGQFERSGAAALVVPSGSCAAQIRHYPTLFADDERMQQRCAQLAAHTHELAQFLVRERKLDSVPGRFDGSATWHDACHGLRDLGLRDEPRRLLGMVPGLRLVEMQQADACCGFGGTFAVTYPEISVAIADQKLQAIARSGADTVVSSDVSCLMHLRGRMQRTGMAVRALHLAEVLTAGCA